MLRIFFLFLFCLTAILKAQDTCYARKTIKTLCSKKYYGRGYYKNGAVKAGTFIVRKMKKAGLKTLPEYKSYNQKFNFNVNIINKISMQFNNINLKPGKDFIVDANVFNTSETAHASSVISEKTLKDTMWFKDLVLFLSTSNESTFYSNFIFIDTLTSETEKKYKNELNIIIKNSKVVILKKKLTWTVATNNSFWKRIEILYSSVNWKNVTDYIVKINVNSTYQNTTQKNVLGYIPGTEKPDSFIIVTAHYDHLGMMGPKAMFPGANDNACGVAMMLDMAKYYAKKPPKYSMVFIAFAGEEAGLIGSQFYVQNPIVPLNKTRFVFNLDLVGTGEEGGTVVNASVFKKEWALLDSINKKNTYLSKLITRGKAANSDHYFFTEAGVPSFFIYLGGPRPSYHDVFDLPETITLAGYNGTFRLIRDFVNGLQH